MVRQGYRIRTDVDMRGLVGAFLFGLAFGAVMAYPALPKSLKVWSFSSASVEAGPIAAPLFLGVGMFLFFFVGVFVLNWLFMEYGGE